MAGETEETAAPILDLARDRTILVFEHDMAFVRSLGARVTVLAEGSIDYVQNHPRVIEVYLGRREAGDAADAVGRGDRC